MQNTWGFVAQHRLVGEDIIGRPLCTDKDPKKRECVHHIDEDKTNNKPENLQVMTFSAHRSHHTKKMNDKREMLLTAKMVEDALVGRTIKQAAEYLGTHHQTLRNRFPEILAPRKRKSPIDMFDEKNVSVVRKYAQDENYSMLMIGKILGCKESSVLKILKLHGIPWKRKTKKNEVHKCYRGKPTRRSLAICESETEPELKTGYYQHCNKKD